MHRFEDALGVDSIQLTCEAGKGHGGLPILCILTASCSDWFRHGQSSGWLRLNAFLQPGSLSVRHGCHCRRRVFCVQSAGSGAFSLCSAPILQSGGGHAFPSVVRLTWWFRCQWAGLEGASLSGFSMAGLLSNHVRTLNGSIHSFQTHLYGRDRA